MTNSTDQLINASLVRLRSKLLDLALRNPLINFKHSPRARRHVRAVDELPEQLFARLNEEKSFRFRSLGKQESEPEDERTVSFQRALDAARLSDPEYLSGLKAAGEDPGDRALQQLDAALRERVRTALGMPPRAAKSKKSVEEVARSKGIDPSFDLASVAPNGGNQGHADGFIQTTLFDNELDRTLTAIRDEVRSSIDETGVNPLYCVFGFIEWFEDGSVAPLHAPLLLLPLEIERTVKSGRWDYSVKVSGEPPLLNVAIAEKFKAEFGVILPPYSDDLAPEEYWKLVSDAIKHKDGWKLRRWITVGLFSFAKISMYRDLDPEVWRGENGLTQHGGLRTLLAAVDAAEQAAQSDGAGPQAVYSAADSVSSTQEMDAIETSVPLILDADSTQFAAIRKVLAGENLVIEGPPGTGKSQTIANIIAAAMMQGKSVLFIAEKMAALNVVNSRLDNAGLGSFCFELHSNKASRKETFKALADRISLKEPKPVDHELKAAVSEVRGSRERLTSLVEALAQRAGTLDCTVQELLWEVQSWRAKTSELPPEIDGVTLLCTPELSETAIDRRLDVAARFAKNRAAILREWKALDGHPWFGLGHAGLDLLAREQLTVRMSRLADAARGALAVCAKWADATGYRPSIIPEVVRALRVVDIPALSPQAIDSVIGRLTDPSAHESLRSWVADAHQFEQLTAQIRSTFTAQDIPSVHQINGAADAIEPLVASDRPIEDLSKVRENELAALKSLTVAHETLVRLRQAFGMSELDESADADRGMMAAAVLSTRASAAILAARTPTLLVAGAASKLQAFTNLLIKARTRRDELARVFVLADCPLAAELREHARAVRSAPRVPMLSAPYRKAKAIWQGMRRERADIPVSAMAAEIDRLAEYRAALDELAAFPDAQQLLGPSYRGLDTDLEPVNGVVKWAETAWQHLKKPGHQTAIREHLFVAAAEDLLRFATHARTLSPDTQKFVQEKTKDGLGISRVLQASREKIALFDAAIARLAVLHCAPLTKLGDLRRVAKDIDAAGILAVKLKDPSTERRMEPIIGTSDPSVPRNIPAYRACVDHADAVRRAGLPTELSNWLLERNAGERLRTLNSLAGQTKESADRLKDAIEGVRGTGDDQRRFDTWLRGKPIDGIGFDDLRAHSELCANRGADLHALVEDAKYLLELNELGLGPVAALLHSGHIPLDLFRDACGRVMYQCLVREELSKHPVLLSFSGDRFTSERERFKLLDKQLQGLRRREIAQKLTYRPIPPGRSVGSTKEWTDLALVKHVTGLQRPSASIRQVLAQAGDAVRELTPCFMMSPLSVAQYLTPETAKFDLVIMDEASQMRPEDAVGAIVRGKQVVIVGDPKQLPPTNFFASSTGNDTTADQDEDDTPMTVDEPSILDAAMTVLRPMQRLKWHYRSRHGSLIAYSNKEFYDQEMVIFPSPHHDHPDYGIRYVHVPEGSYRAGVNPPEAKRVATAVLEHTRRHPNRSLGVAALNVKQAELLRLELDSLATSEPDFAVWMEKFENSLEPFFVKNLENIQGDERDTILISTVYGKNEAGEMFQRFGPINNNGGQRRLNVLFTRAKFQTIVYSSMLPSEIRVDEQTKWGPRALQGFLAYAKDGTFDTAIPTGREPDSDFEHAVIGAIRNAGYEAVPQVGVVGYFIDIGVRHPKLAGKFALGVECDGATYHSTKSARDRDRLRQEVLENLGWSIHRIWSLDWFRDPAKETRRLVEAIGVASQRE